MEITIDMDEAHDLANIRLSNLHANGYDLEAFDELIALLKDMRAQCKKELE